MKNIVRCLLSCNTLEELQALKNLCTPDYVVATNNYLFYKEIQAHEEQTIFMESNEGNPYEETWNILDQINKIVDLYAKEDYLFHINYSITGGFPSKIAQMIINLNLIHRIIRDYKIDEIYLFDGKENWVINESIFLYAKSRGIMCHILNDGGCGIELKTLKSMGKLDDGIGNLCADEQSKVNRIVEQELTGIQNSGSNKEEIGVLYCCKLPYNKHVDWTLKRIDVIGGRVKVICFYRTEDMEKFKNVGLSVDCIEDYFIPEIFLEEYQEAGHKRKSILNAMEKKLSVSYRQVDLTAYIIMKLRNYYYRELVTRVYVNVCAKKYFEKNLFRYINIWVNTGFWETVVCYGNTRKNDTKLFSIDSVSFIRFMIKQPYQNMLSAVFLPNEETFKMAYTEDFCGKVCYIPDYIWEGGDKCGFSFNNKKKKIGFFPTGVIGGFTTFYFYYNVLFPLIQKLLDADFDVLFKYHPGMSDCWEEDVRRKYSVKANFKFYNQWEPINGVMKECDLIITDTSSVACDAAAVGKVVFCIVDGQGYELISQHKDGFCIYRNIEDVMKHVSSVLADSDTYKKIIERQDRYLSKWTGSKNAFDSGFIKNFLYDLK